MTRKERKAIYDSFLNRLNEAEIANLKVVAYTEDECPYNEVMCGECELKKAANELGLGKTSHMESCVPLAKMLLRMFDKAIEKELLG